MNTNLNLFLDALINAHNKLCKQCIFIANILYLINILLCNKINKNKKVLR